MLPALAALALVANVLARTAYHREDPTGRTQVVTYTNYYDVPTGADGGTIEISHHDCDIAPHRNYDNRNQHDDDVHGAEGEDRRVHHRAEPVYTNAKPTQNNFNIKHTEIIDHDAARGGVILYDNINYDQTPPFTNKNGPDSEKTPDKYTQVNSTGPITLPGVTLGTKSPQTSQASSRGGSQAEQTTPRLNETSTEAEFVLEDRVAFSGDQCPTGYAKVYGKCVEIQ